VCWQIGEFEDMLLRFLALVLASSCLGAPTVTGDRKNVLFLVVDDMRPSLGAYNYTHARTPNMDALASQSRKATPLALPHELKDTV